MARSMSEGDGPFRLAASPSHLLHRAEQLASDRFQSLVGDSVTLRQYAVLAAIAERPGLSQNDLVRITGIDRSTITEMMRRMQARGWITRATSAADKRMQSVHLAASGSLILAAATPAAKAADAAVLKLLPRTKARTFLNILAKLAKLADEAADKEARHMRRRAKRDAKARAKERARTKPTSKQTDRRARKPRRT